MDEDLEPYLTGVQPILAVRNVMESVTYWHEMLGFPHKWTWGDPPNHGGVHWHNAAVQFTENLNLAAVSEGHSIAINVKNIDALYVLHQTKKVNIVSSLENQPWGMAEYTVKDINGYYVRFGAPVSGRIPGVKFLPAHIKVIAGPPTPQDFRNLITSVNWSTPLSDEMLDSQFRNCVFALSALDTSTGNAIGCAFLLGDNVGFYYVRDVIVHPDYQEMGIGTAMMRELTCWLENNAPDNATVGLFTGDHLAPFYKQFGFMQACGMYKQIQRSGGKNSS